MNRAPASQGTIYPLTSVRFFAAFYVVLVHSVEMSHHVDVSFWGGRFLRDGYTAVGFFFVLSGYILAHVYLDTDRPFSRLSFWTSRFARAYPLLFASLILDWPRDLFTRIELHGWASGCLRSITEFVSEAFLLQSWDAHLRNINAPSWSLSAEAFFYFLFPFVSFWIWRRKGFKAFGLIALFWMCALLAPLLVTLRHPMLFVEVDSSKLQASVELMPVFRMFEFFAGISLCSLQKSLAEKFTVVKMGRVAYLFIGIACALFISAIELSNHIPLLMMSNGFLLPVSALMIMGLANLRGWPAKVLSNRHLVLLGEASYAVYLLHMPIWSYFEKIHPIDSLPIWLLFVVIVIATSVASFIWLERPCRKAILRLATIRPRIILDQEAASQAVIETGVQTGP